MPLPGNYSLLKAFAVFHAGGSEVGPEFPHNLQGERIWIANIDKTERPQFPGVFFEFFATITGATLWYDRDGLVTHYFLELDRRVLGDDWILGLEYCSDALSVVLMGQQGHKYYVEVDVKTSPASE